MTDLNNYLTEISNNICSSISSQQDSLILEVFKENNIDYTNLSDLIKNCEWYIPEKNSFPKTLFYKKNPLLVICEPEVKFEDYKLTCEVKYKKLYEKK